jgi:hypothetical protein
MIAALTKKLPTTLSGLLLGTLCMAGGAFAQTEKPVRYGAMALDNGYRMTLRHDGETLQTAWRPFGKGRAPQAPFTPAQTQVIAKVEERALPPLPGSQAAILQARTQLAVVIDTRDDDRLFDQLSAIRIMLAAADFERQSWHFFRADSPAQPITKIENDAALEEGWQSLRALMPAQQAATKITSLSPTIQAIASLPGDRKALIIPRSLMPLLTPGLTPQGIAGLQAFGISLYPLTGAMPDSQRQAYETLAELTGGYVLNWMDIPPDTQSAFAAFRPLSAGGTAAFTMPQPPWQPWLAPAPVGVTLVEGSAAQLTTFVPRPASAWSALPWAGLSALAALFIACGIAATLWFKRQNKVPLRARITDLSTQKSYEIAQWPATLGRADTADITIANAHLAPLHARLSDNGTGLEIKTLEGAAQMTIKGKQHSIYAFYEDGTFELSGAPFKVTFLSGLA